MSGPRDTGQPVRVSRAAARRARRLAYQLIEWEINTADSDPMMEACEEFGSAVIVAALETIQSQIAAKGMSE